LLVFPVTFHCSFQQLYHCPSIKYFTVLCPFNSCITVVGRSLGCLTTLCPLHSCFTDLPTPEKSSVWHRYFFSTLVWHRHSGIVVYGTGAGRHGLVR
jgi:hypothetical protein